MTSALLPTRSIAGHSTTQIASRAAAAAITHGHGAHAARDGDEIAAIEGFWRWRDTSLTQYAHERGPAESLLRGYRDRGIDILDRLQGSFALAILDSARDEALLAVDRVGTRPLAYGRFSDGLVFGSTLDAILAHPGAKRSLDLQGVFHYLYFHVVPSPGTIYTGLEKLEPAQYLHYRAGRHEIRNYWLPAFDEGPAEFEPLARDLRATLERAVRRADPENQSGAFLSGGLDSSTVSGMLAKTQRRRARTYSIGFDVRGYDEIEYARIAARHFDTEAHEYYVRPDDVVTTLALIARIYDEPFGNSSALPVYCCARLAKSDGVNVLLAGDGGDEIFAGNARYAKQMLFEQYDRLPAVVRRGIVEPVLNGMPGLGAVAPVRKLQRYVEQARIPLPDRLETYNLLHMIPLPEIFAPEFLAAVDTDGPLRLLRQSYRRTNATHPVNRMLYLDWKFTLADNDLRKVNRMTEHAGVEVRYPMLDDELLELSARVPPALKLRGRQLRYFFKRALSDFLPKEIITKPKHGFGLPFGEWLRVSPDLQLIVDDSLHGMRARGWLRPEFIDRVLHDHRTGHAGFYGGMLWVLAMLELWLKAHRH
ncbi:MAG TPA: asparagine synthase-related protein [Burkholderiales bacterium]